MSVAELCLFRLPLHEACILIYIEAGIIILDCILENFMMCTSHQIVFGGSDEEE